MNQKAGKQKAIDIHISHIQLFYWEAEWIWSDQSLPGLPLKFQFLEFIIGFTLKIWKGDGQAI